MMIRDLFLSDVTRDIPPVVYFHEQIAGEARRRGLGIHHHGRLAGGPPEPPPGARGIHEQYVQLLRGIIAELDKPGGPELPNAWISGFYGSGKSSFAKLLGLALDGVALPDGGSLAEALLRRDTSPNADELSAAWNELRKKVDPLAVVFDIGGRRPRQRAHPRRGRPPGPEAARVLLDEPLVADFELNLERDGEWKRFEETGPGCSAAPGPSEGQALAEDDFSLVLSELYPDRVHRPDELVHEPGRDDTRRGVAGGRRRRDPRHAQVPQARAHALPRRRRGLAVRPLEPGPRGPAAGVRDGPRLRASRQGLAPRARSAEARRGGRRLRSSSGPRTASRPSLRVHLAATNIRDVVHRRLLQKRPEVEAAAPRALREAPGRPQALRVRLRLGHPRRVRRGLPDAPGARRPAPADHDRTADPLGPGPGRRPGDPRPAPAPRRALPRPEARRHGGGLARDPRPGLRGAAHRARLRRAVDHGADPQPVRRTTRPSCWSGRRRRWRCSSSSRSHADRREARRAVPLRPGRPRQPGERGHRGAGGAPPPEPPRLLREAGVQDPVDGGRGVGARAARHRRPARGDRRARAGGTQVPARHAGPPAARGPPVPVGRAVLRRPPRRRRQPRRPARRGDGPGRLPLPRPRRPDRGHVGGEERPRPRCTTGWSGSAATPSRSRSTRGSSTARARWSRSTTRAGSR